MGQILGMDVPIDMPTFGGGGGAAGGGLGPTVWGFIFLLIFILILGIVAIVLMKKFKTFNKKIVVFENISGKGYQLAFKDRARLVRLGDGGEELLYLLKKKIYRAAYGKKMGKNTYWFAIGQDGYWYNIILGDVDAKKGMLDIEPIDRDMRYMHVAIRKNIQDRYKKVNIMDKYGTFILSGIFLIIMLIGMWFLLDKIGDINQSSAASVEASEDVVKSTKNVIVSLDNVIKSLNDVLRNKRVIETGG